MSRNDKRATRLTGTVRTSQKSQARQQAAQLAKEQQRRDRRRRTTLITLAGLVVAAVVVAGTVFVLSQRGGPTTAPPEVGADGGFLVGDPGAAVTVQVVEDFQCPACQAFEAQAGSVLAGYAEGGDVNVDYRGIAFLDRASSTEYSSRALNASACVMGSGEEVWKEFHEQMYLQQPAEGGAGLPDSELVSIATAAGAPASVSSCIEDGTYRDWVAATTDRAGDDGVDSTPTILVDGEVLPTNSLEALQTAVDAALAS